MDDNIISIESSVLETQEAMGFIAIVLQLGQNVVDAGFHDVNSLEFLSLVFVFLKSVGGCSSSRVMRSVYERRKKTKGDA